MFFDGANESLKKKGLREREKVRERGEEREEIIH